ncbi:hypothetical protein [Aminipila terrae]|uniref:Uncharacterized protein n=1 Tax=Aminipila terrae TaxID=2697030 RepID=A0A6P1MLY3_9FIRM|nr:hypothetical protein [Aminipila terrae]QHI73088.1 hypothetical protein Ami3637_12365 [Aminipila terrae]
MVKEQIILALLTSLLSGGIGSVVGFLISSNQRRKDRNDEIKFYSTILKNDLESICNYFSNERGSVNLRYFADWQKNIAKCAYLCQDEVALLYEIYDKCFNYSYHYILKEKTGSVCKDNINEYKQLNQIFAGNKYLKLKANLICHETKK